MLTSSVPLLPIIFILAPSFVLGLREGHFSRWEDEQHGSHSPNYGWQLERPLIGERHAQTFKLAENREENSVKLDALLRSLYREREGTVKRKAEVRSLKCLQTSAGGFTCFGEGRFYRFPGLLKNFGSLETNSFEGGLGAYEKEETSRRSRAFSRREIRKKLKRKAKRIGSGSKRYLPGLYTTLGRRRRRGYKKPTIPAAFELSAESPRRRRNQNPFNYPSRPENPQLGSPSGPRDRRGFCVPTCPCFAPTKCSPPPKTTCPTEEDTPSTCPPTRCPTTCSTTCQTTCSTTKKCMDLPPQTADGGGHLGSMDQNTNKRGKFSDTSQPKLSKNKSPSSLASIRNDMNTINE